MPSTAPRPVRLIDLAVNSLARFHEARLDARSCKLLRALGLTQSCQVRLCKKGEPCIIQIRTTRIGLSKSVAGSIYVIPTAAAGAV